MIENAHILSAESQLDDRQRKYAFRDLKQASFEPLNGLLSLTLRYKDKLVQLGEFSEGNLQWADYTNKKMRNLSQRLAKKLTSRLDFDVLKGFEMAHRVENRVFNGQISILDKENAKLEAQNADILAFNL